MLTVKATLPDFARSQSKNWYVCVCFLSEVCFLHVCGNGWDQNHVLCMFYPCFTMIGSHSLQYDWFPLSVQYTGLKCAESLAAAKAATLTAARKRQHWQHRIGRSARWQQWPKEAAALATARRPQYRPQLQEAALATARRPQSSGRSTGHSAQAT